MGYYVRKANWICKALESRINGTITEFVLRQRNSIYCDNYKVEKEYVRFVEWIIKVLIKKKYIYIILNWKFKENTTA